MYKVQNKIKFKRLHKIHELRSKIKNPLKNYKRKYQLQVKLKTK